jgi:hypothetical protein
MWNCCRQLKDRWGNLAVLQHFSAWRAGLPAACTSREIKIEGVRFRPVVLEFARMISDHLAKKLKDAGFPQSELARAQQKAGYDYVSMPALSALIEACRDNFGALGREADHWLACGYISEYGEWKNSHAGNSPEDAVARMWLSISRAVAADNAA